MVCLVSRKGSVNCPLRGFALWLLSWSWQPRVVLHAAGGLADAACPGESAEPARCGWAPPADARAGGDSKGKGGGAAGSQREGGGVKVSVS